MCRVSHVLLWIVASSLGLCLLYPHLGFLKVGLGAVCMSVQFKDMRHMAQVARQIGKSEWILLSLPLMLFAYSTLHYDVTFQRKGCR